MVEYRFQWKSFLLAFPLTILVILINLSVFFHQEILKIIRSNLNLFQKILIILNYFQSYELHLKLLCFFLSSAIFFTSSSNQPDNYTVYILRWQILKQILSSEKDINLWFLFKQIILTDLSISILFIQKLVWIILFIRLFL